MPQVLDARNWYNYPLRCAPNGYSFAFLCNMARVFTTYFLWWLSCLGGEYKYPLAYNIIDGCRVKQVICCWTKLRVGSTSSFLDLRGICSINNLPCWEKEKARCKWPWEFITHCNLHHISLSSQWYSPTTLSRFVSNRTIIVIWFKVLFSTLSLAIKRINSIQFLCTYMHYIGFESDFRSILYWLPISIMLLQANSLFHFRSSKSFPQWIWTNCFWIKFLSLITCYLGTIPCSFFACSIVLCFSRSSWWLLLLPHHM